MIENEKCKLFQVSWKIAFRKLSDVGGFEFIQTIWKSIPLEKSLSNNSTQDILKFPKFSKFRGNSSSLEGVLKPYYREQGLKYLEQGVKYVQS